jgi:hypothetical protein
VSLAFNAIELLGVALQVILLLLLLVERSPRFLVLLLYSVFRLVADIAEVSVSRRLGYNAVAYAKVYWSSEVLINVLMFLMVIVFTYQALEGNQLRAKAARILVGAVILAVLAPLIIYHRRMLFSTSWFNGMIQWFNFGAAVMNLGLWTSLLLNKKRDPQLLVVSIGLGVMTAGAAVYFGLRQFTSHSDVQRALANMAGTLTHVLGLAVWCWAFRPAFMRHGSAEQPAPAATSSGY